MKVKEFLWHALGDYVQRTDVNQDLDPEGENRGFQQRYCEGIGEWVDDNLLYFIDNLLIVTRYSPLPTVVPLLERHLGLDAPLYEDMSLRTKLVRYLKRCNRNKGSLRNYRFLLGLLNFDVAIEETYPSGKWDKDKWDNKKWDQAKSINATYHLTLTKRFNFPTTPILLAQIERIIAYNNPMYVLQPTYTIIGYEPIISIEPDTLLFPQTILGNTFMLSFTVTNLGNANLELTNLDLPIQFTSDFAPTTISPSEEVTFEVTFTPINAGNFSHNIVLENDAFIGNNIIEVVASSVAATRTINISPTSLAFDAVSVGSTATQSFIISNTGNSTLNVSSIDFPFGTYTADWTNGTIEAGASRTITVTFAPTTNGAQDGTITVSSDKTSGANTVAVTAVGFLELGIELNGISNYLKTTGNIVSIPYLSNFTLSYYFRTPAIFPSQSILSCFASPAFSIGVDFDGARPVFKRDRNFVQQSVRLFTGLLPNTIYKIDCVSEGAGASNMKIYINGELASTSVTADNAITPNDSPSGDLYFGRYGTFNLSYLGGTLYYARIYTYALTPEQITEQVESLYPITPLPAHAWEIQVPQNSSTLPDDYGSRPLSLGGFSVGEQANAIVDLSNNSII